MANRERFLEWYKQEAGTHEDAQRCRPFAWAAWQAACPKGWQCVPVEPTDEMTKASTWSGNGDVSVSEEWARKTVYGRMLSAAPKPEDAK